MNQKHIWLINYIKVKWFRNKFTPWTNWAIPKRAITQSMIKKKNWINFSVLKKYLGSKLFQNWYILYDISLLSEEKLV